MHPLIWFRADLRTLDNTALSAATAAASGQATALFVLCPTQWLGHDYSPARVELMLRTLAELRQALAELNIPLVIEHAAAAADVPALVLKVAQTHHCDALYFNSEYEIDERRRDETTSALFSAAKLAVKQKTDQVIFEPGEVRTGEGKYFTIFTPFKRAWIKNALRTGSLEDNSALRPHARPKKMLPRALSPNPIPLAIKGYTSHVAADHWKGGELHARTLLAAFVDKRITNYKEARDFPATHGTSSLSPYLTIGAISPRQCLAAALKANTTSTSPLDAGLPGVVTWISELIWREFYVCVLRGFPRVSMNRAFQPTTERIRWNDNPQHAQAFFQGRTGVPIVDAGIRQMLTTGWMHNRIRMVVAMYFTKNLFLDWRIGERFFMQHLVDGFLASNNGGWQWSASTGTDAAPYFRVFNPVSQSERFDAGGDYIRRWVPELKHLDSAAIHAPWQLAPLALSRLDYPQPLVDLSASRAHAINAFKKLRT